MIYVLIGHRGTGKSALLRRIAVYYAQAQLPVHTLDLDDELSLQAGLPLTHLLPSLGEPAFRALEHEVLSLRLADLCTRPPAGDVYVALGAGFLPPLPAGVHAIWVQRPSDVAGRVFLDRPRLDPAQSPLDEYHTLYTRRTPRYAALAHDQLVLAEGADRPTAAEGAEILVRFATELSADSLARLPLLSPIALTLLPRHLADTPSSLRAWIQRRLRLPGLRIELRDDLLPNTEHARVAALLPAPHQLVSHRLALPLSTAPPPAAGTWVDLPLERSPCPTTPATLWSLHTRLSGESVGEAADRLARQAPPHVLCKLAVPVESFAALSQGHAWMMQAPHRRIFLPISPSGRWAWYRLWTSRHQPLTFYREGAGSAPDQPTLTDLFALPPPPASSPPTTFAAVLGTPIAHSRTPIEQHAFFAARGMPIFRIEVDPHEWPVALPFLTALGLTHAAVTSPLKHLAAQLVAPTAGPEDALNTLVRTSSALDAPWFGDNTDVAGAHALQVAIRAALPALATPQVAVWGGGGVLPALRAAFPQALYFAARTGHSREGNLDARRCDPDVVIWAAPAHAACLPPPARWTPQVVADVSYADASPARAYALATQARFVSGLVWFQAQAAAQRTFWAAVAPTHSLRG